jgi:hypothetical protein
MNTHKLRAVPPYDFRACADIQAAYAVRVKECLCPWIRSEGAKDGKTFDYGEVFVQLHAVKTHFTHMQQKLMLAHCEPSVARNVLLPEILSWGEDRPHVSLLAVLYTMPGDAKPRFLRSVALGMDPSTGQASGTLCGKRDTAFDGFTVSQSFRISDFQYPDRALVEFPPLT